MEEKPYIKTKSRCRETLYLLKHKCMNYKGFGYRCKYCSMPLKVLLDRDYRRKMKW